MALKIFGNTFEIDKKALEAAAKEAFLHLRDDFDVNFRFISESRMKELNRVYRKKDRVTDVLSFKLDQSEPGGDVVICYKEVNREAKLWQMAQTDVASFLLIHGLLHLWGMDHENRGERVKMEKAETAILKKIGIKLNR